MPGYNTNLASEFYVLSVLHRLGLHALITLGNKKSVDIVVEYPDRPAITIDVKGIVASSKNWPVGQACENRTNHFMALLCYTNISDPNILPDLWIVPRAHLEQFVYTAPKSGMRIVPVATMIDYGADYKNAWHLLTSGNA